MWDRKLHPLLLGIDRWDISYQGTYLFTDNSYKIMTYNLQCIVHKICCTSVISQMSNSAEFVISVLYSKINITQWELHFRHTLEQSVFIVYKNCSWYEMPCCVLVLDSLTGWVMWPCCIVKSWTVIKILRHCLVQQSQLALVPNLHLQLFLEPAPSDHPGNRVATSHPLPLWGATVHLHWMISDHYLMEGDDIMFEHTCKNVVRTTENKILEAVFV